MWLLDKITKVDDQGWGWVLGGKPINLDDLAKCVTRDTVSRNLHRLEHQGYIVLRHTPYGIVVKVAKAKKRFGRNVELGSAEMSNLPRKNVEPNKTVSVDSNSKTLVKSVATSSPAKAPNPEVQELMGALREANAGFLDGSEFENRRYAWLLLQKMRKLAKDPAKAKEAVLYVLAAARASPFHAKNATSFKYLFYNAARIVQEKKVAKSKFAFLE